MFIEEIPRAALQKATCPQVNVMGYSWSGIRPFNWAPEVTAMTINGRTANGGITLAPGEPLVAAVTARDPDADEVVIKPGQGAYAGPIGARIKVGPA